MKTTYSILKLEKGILVMWDGPGLIESKKEAIQILQKRHEQLPKDKFFILKDPKQ